MHTLWCLNEGIYLNNVLERWKMMGDRISLKIEDEKRVSNKFWSEEVLKRTNFGLVQAAKMVWTKRVEPDGADGSDPGREEQISQACC